MSFHSEPLVSIVTPAYNEERYLAECIESVLAQTYRNWEYTIVDNCSKDDTLSIAQKYAAGDPRIRVFTNESFLRAIPNHNVAFRQVSPGAKYCKMVMADDWLFKDCLEQMVAVGERDASVGLVGAYALKGTAVVGTGLPYQTTVLSGRDACRMLFIGKRYLFGSSTSQLFRADLVRARNPFYNESNLHADMEVCCDILKTCNFGFVHQILSYSRVREECLTAMSDGLRTEMVGSLYALVTHGRFYLSAEEFETRLRGFLAYYYDWLARDLIAGKDKKFWDYHKRKLDELGLGFSRFRLTQALCRRVMNAVFNPKLTLEELLSGRNVLNGRLGVLRTRGTKAIAELPGKAVLNGR